jgi:23S rRNA (cytidine1920-2'-O)/16S rRNA (cytidine1409-2'-O)-methyltransferase
VSPATAKRPRVRLDQLLVERGLVETRTRAQALVLAGQVRVGTGDGARLDRKPGDLIDPATPVGLVERDPYVSRGGHKLAAALDAFEIDPSGRVALDVGASTGGFTDVLLQRGATRVYALDVGRGQLHASLRSDPRVVVLEGRNARHLDSSEVPEPIDLMTIDVSFISLRLVAPAVIGCLAPGADLVALIKPQFEAPRGSVGKGGILRDEELRRSVVAERARDLAALGLELLGVIDSPVHGAGGNREALAHLRRPTSS